MRLPQFRPSMMRMTIGVVFAAVLTVSSAAQDFMAQPGVPAAVFPKPDRPVADIISPIWHTEKERDDADEPGQLVRLLGIKTGMTVADIGAGSGYYVVRLSPIVGSNGRRTCRLRSVGFAMSTRQIPVNTRQRGVTCWQYWEIRVRNSHFSTTT